MLHTQHAMGADKCSSSGGSTVTPATLGAPNSAPVHTQGDTSTEASVTDINRSDGRETNG